MKIRIDKIFAYTLVFLLAGIFSSDLKAQEYKNAAGVKAGYSTGIIFTHFFEDEYSLKGQALYNLKGFQFSGLFSYQFSPYPKERLQYYGGAGIHGGNWDSDLAIGAALLVGAEYIFRNTPLVIGLEWKPMLNLYRQFDFAIPDIGLTVKVILNK